MNCGILLILLEFPGGVSDEGRMDIVLRLFVRLFIIKLMTTVWWISCFQEWAVNVDTP